MIHTVEERSITLLGNRLYLREAGRGNPVLFLHGFPTHGAIWTHLLSPVAEAGYHAIAPDLLGYGKSDHPAGTPLDLREQADLLAHLMDELALAPAHVVGHDIGGGVAQHLAVAHPERVRSLFLVNPASFDAWPHTDWGRFKGANVEAATAQPQIVADALRRLLPQGGSGDWRLPQEMVDLFVAPWSDAHGAAAFIRAAAQLDSIQTAGLADHLRDIGMPTHVLWGRLDPWQGVEHARMWEEHYPGAVIDVVDAGHWVPLQASDLLLERCMRWFRAQGPRRVTAMDRVSTHKTDTP